MQAAQAEQRQPRPDAVGGQKIEELPVKSWLELIGRPVRRSPRPTPMSNGIDKLPIVMHQVHELSNGDYGSCPCSRGRRRVPSMPPGPGPGPAAAPVQGGEHRSCQPGKAAKVAAPATISHTSLPSQNGAIVSSAASRSGAVRPTTVGSGDLGPLIRGFDLAQLVAEIHLDHDGCGRTCARRDSGRASRY